MATIQDLGKVAYLNKGVYNSETTYEINDVVSFNGSSYVSKTNENRGNLPTNTIYWSIVASKGDKGETGKPFVIEKTYMTIEAMVADYDNMNINDYVMISGNIEEEQNATLWTKTANEVSPYKWEYLADFSGASGITGATPNIIIGNVTEGNQPAVTRRAGSSNENPILDFILKTGPKGDIGDTGNGISSIEKTGTSGLVDTYTITYTNGTTSTFQVTNGEDAEITPEEFEELQNEVNELKDENQRLKATLPTTTGTGETITLDKTAELDFVVPPLPEGNTVQDGEPTPTAPVEVQVVKGDVEVKVENGNLVNEDNLEVFNNNKYVKFNDNYYINVEPNTAYTLSIEVFAGDGKFVEYDENNNTLKEISIYSILTNGYVTITTTANTKKIKFYAQMYSSVPSETPTKYTAKCMLEKGSTSSPYTPHQEQKLPLTLGNIELCKIGDYKDKFEKDNGKWYLHKEIGKMVLDGSENEWTKSSNTTEVDRFTYNTNLYVNDANSKCNYFIKSGITTTIGRWYNNANVQVGFSFTEYGTTTLEEWKEWLSTHNLILVQPLVTPTNTEITDTTLISQLEAIYNAISYYEQTNISGTSSGINPLFDVEAYQSTKLLLENALDRLELLES